MPRYPPQYTSRPSIDAKTTPYDEVFEENSSSPGIAQPSALPYIQPRKTPQIDPISLPPQSADTITLLHRSPTTPPIHKTEGKRRSRSFTAPSLSRRHTVPVLALPVYGKCPKSPDLEITALGLTRQVLLEHFGNRVKEIQGGDGELNLDDAVSPEILPPQAIPHHLHRRHYSTTSLPPLFDQTHLTTPVHPRTLEREEPMSPLSQPSFLTPTRIAEEEDSPYIPRGYSPSPPCPHLHAMGSHSPLSTCKPMTPGSSKPRQPRTPLSDLDA